MLDQQIYIEVEEYGYNKWELFLHACLVLEAREREILHENK